MAVNFNPTDLYLSDPVGVDFEIQELQKELEHLQWLEYSFGRAFLSVRPQTGEPNYLYPAVYIGKKDYYDASPNDYLRAYSFMTADSPITVESYDVGEYLKLNQQVSLIVWGNLNKVNQSLGNRYGDEHFGSELLHQILSVIKLNRSFTVKSIHDNARTVFSDFSVRNKNYKLFYHPYFCYKIVMNCTFEQECYENI
jgi:hypothetical protein